MLPGNGICGYTLDGQQMQNGLRQKLQNTAYFGNSGIVDCSVDLLPLPKNPNRQDIDDLACSIIFIGNHPYNPMTNAPNLSGSAIETSSLLEIRDWSMECDFHLVILTQAETVPWGYKVENVNINPNYPASDDGFIFNGRFGRVDQFNQGGTYQGNFVEFPDTGYIILGIDVQGNPTMLLDEVTNDILLADVGILCSGAGDVSNGPNIATDNDILALNIFDLGCQIADRSYRQTTSTKVCEDETHTLPNGMIVNETTYFSDTLIAVNGCDSILNYFVEFMLYDTTRLDLTSCAKENLFFFEEEIRYDINNPTGMAVYQNELGCDSFVLIDLEYFKEDSTFFEFDICSYDFFIVDDLAYAPDQDHEIIYTNQNGCDSTLFLRLNSYPSLIGEIQTRFDVIQNEPIILSQEIEAGAIITWEPSEGLSCAECSSPSLLPDFFIQEYSLKIEDQYGCISFYQIEIDYNCEPYIPNIFSPSEAGPNSRFVINPLCPLDNFQLDIYSRWGDKVYSSNTIEQSWDGKNGGHRVMPGVYVYKLQYTQFEELIEKVGDVTVF